MRRLSIWLRPRAEDDLESAFRYLEREAGTSTAIRFEQAIQAALQRLSELPDIGAPWPTSDPRLGQVRKWGVPKFSDYLLFYRQEAGAIHILRILHGARDIDRILLDPDDGELSPGLD
jgi:toxin ParE1/3/4